MASLTLWSCGGGVGGNVGSWWLKSIKFWLCRKHTLLPWEKHKNVAAQALSPAAAAITSPTLNSQSSLSSNTVAAGNPNHNTAEGQGYWCNTSKCLEWHYNVHKARDIKLGEMRGCWRSTYRRFHCSALGPLRIDLFIKVNTKQRKWTQSYFSPQTNRKAEYFTKRGTSAGREMSPITFTVTTIQRKKNIRWWEDICHSSRKLMIYSQLQTLIASRNKHVAHLMEAGHKCNKAAKVIRSATGRFTTAHTPHIGLWREIWWTKEVELSHLQMTRGGLMACDGIHSYTLIPAAVTVCSGLS